MNDRFKFNAIVSSYYDIDTPDNYEEFEPQFYLKNVDVFCTQEIGIDYDTLFDAVKDQSKDLTEKEIGQIMQHFEDNSNSPDCDFVTITPDKILQCTGLKDKNGTLIYEGDIVTYEWLTPIGKVWRNDGKCIVRWFGDGFNPIHNIAVYNVKDGTTRNVKVIGNIYENPELLEDTECTEQ